MPKTRRDFLTSASAASLLAACAGGAGQRPNVLWIIAEDFSPELGCYGDPDVATPHIDRLAAEGVRYTNACVTAPVCSIARSALMTGMYQTSIGAHHHRSHRTDGHKLPAGVRPFTALLREAGYHTSNLKDTEIGGRGKTDFNFNLDEKPFDGTDWTERAEGQPFYAQINFQETHRAFKRSPARPIDPTGVRLPPYYPNHPVVRKDWALYLETAQVLDEKVGKTLARLEEQGLAEDTIVIFFGDHGRAMPRGKQFCYEGGMVIPLIVRIPEKFRPAGFEPGAVDERLVSHIDLTATTLAYAGVARPDGMEARVFIGPESDPERETLFCARDRCDETTDRIRAARTKRHKYIRNFHPERPYAQPNHYKDTSYPSLQVLRQLDEEGELSIEQALFLAKQRPEEELYDLEADPYEVRNLAGSSEHGAILADLRGRTEAWIAETGDTGARPEGPLPEEYDWRTHVDGFASNLTKMSRSNGVLRVECGGERNEFTRPWVAEGGDLVVRFRVRSTENRPQELFWGTVDNVRSNGNRMAMEQLEPDGRWREVGLRFAASDWLVNFGFSMAPGPGVVEFERIRLERPAGGLIREWTFEG